MTETAEIPRIVLKAKATDLTPEACAAIYREANQAAQHEASLIPVNYTGHTLPKGGRIWVEDPTVRGTAYVVLGMGTKFARWAKAQGITTDLRGGRIDILQYGQDVERKRAYARMFAAVLKRHGISADSYYSTEQK